MPTVYGNNNKKNRGYQSKWKEKAMGKREFMSSGKNGSMQHVYFWLTFFKKQWTLLIYLNKMNQKTMVVK